MIAFYYFYMGTAMLLEVCDCPHMVFVMTYRAVRDLHGGIVILYDMITFDRRWMHRCLNEAKGEARRKASWELSCGHQALRPE